MKLRAHVATLEIPVQQMGFVWAMQALPIVEAAPTALGNHPAVLRFAKVVSILTYLEREIRCVNAYTTKPHRIVSATYFHALSTTAASQARSVVEHEKAAKTQKQDAATRASFSLIKVELEDSSTPRNSSQPLLSPLRQPRLRHQLRKPRAVQLPRP